MGSTADQRRERIDRKHSGLRSVRWAARWIWLLLTTRERKGTTTSDD